MMRYGTVCSGIGAPEAAVLRAGLDWRCSFMSEIEKFPRAVLKHHFPNHPLHGDFTTIQRGDYDPVDVLIGGTPCQDFSVAGKRLGLDAPRGNLALEYLALARRLGSRWLVWENVPGMLSSWSDDEIIEPGESILTLRQRNDFATFLSFLGKCGYGYAWRVLDGQHFRVPQRRRRIVLVAYLGDWRPAAAVLFERESLRGDITPRRESGEGIAGSLSARTKGGGGLGTDFDLDGGLVTHSLRAEGFDASEDGTGRGTPLIPCEAWASQMHDHKVIAFQAKQSASSQGPSFDDVAPTLDVSKAGGMSIVHEMSVRRLTPTECERLMDFDDGWTAIEYNGKPAADGPRYKSLGNSMIVEKIRWVLSRLDRVEKIMGEGHGTNK